MKKGAMLFALVFVSVLLMPAAVFAQRGGRQGETLEVRLASFMPRNSDWGRTLDRIAAEWARATNNEVRLRVIHDGIEGGEQRMLSSLSADNIQAALFASFGLAAICPSVMTLSVPFLIQNDNELDLVLREVQPVMDAQISNTNYVVLAWSRGGWVNIFSKDPVFTPDDMRRHRIATNPDSADINQAFKTMGFHLIETEMMDLGTKMANNVINAMYQTPLAVAPLGLHKNLRNMLEKPIAPFLGAVVINRVTWNKIKPEYQRELLRITQRFASEFDSSMPRTTANAVATMRRDGLSVNKPSPAHEEMWRQDVQRAMPQLLGTTFDRDIYQQITGILEKARAAR